jgi:hypothetical protein
MQPVSEWGDDEKTTLAQHWRSSITCEEIGQMCGGRTKNAVISQAARMKLGAKPRGRSRLHIAPATNVERAGIAGSIAPRCVPGNAH